MTFRFSNQEIDCDLLGPPNSLPKSGFNMVIQDFDEPLMNERPKSFVVRRDYPMPRTTNLGEEANIWKGKLRQIISRSSIGMADHALASLDVSIVFMPALFTEPQHHHQLAKSLLQEKESTR